MSCIWGYTSVRLGGGADKILLGEDGKISINNFRPGVQGLDLRYEDVKKNPWRLLIKTTSGQLLLIFRAQEFWLEISVPEKFEEACNLIRVLAR